MTLTLDPQLEQRIQREIDLGHYGDPAEVIAHALDLLDSQEPWSEEDRADLDQRLAQSMAQAANGQVYTAEEAARLLDQRIADRIAKKAS